MATAQLELVITQIKSLSLGDKLRLLEWVTTDFQPAIATPPRRGLIYGEFADAPERMSTEEDFKLAEWHPTEEQPAAPALESTGLVYGKYRDTGRPMSTEEDFKIAEWRPTEAELNGE